jgi:hypothetical protein
MADLTDLEPGVTVLIDGKKYGLMALSVGGFRRVQQYLNEQPSPYQRAVKSLQGVPDDLARPHLEEAVARSRDWPPKLGSAASLDFALSYEGLAVIGAEMLRRANPELNDQTIADLAEKLDPTEVMKAFNLAFGQTGDAPDPKSPDGPSTPPTP